MEKDILNYSPTVMFRGNPVCNTTCRPLFNEIADFLMFLKD